MKFGRPFSIIKALCRTWALIQFFLIKDIIIRRLKSEITQISNLQSFLKFSRPLAIIVCYTLQFNLECCKSPVLDMGPKYYFKNNNKIS